MFEKELDRQLEVMLAAKDVGPEARHKLKGILKWMRGKAHPFTACFTADTPVDAPRDMGAHPEGVPISELRPGDIVWSFNEGERAFELRRVLWAEITRRDAALVAVTLDTGAVVRCTPDHRFMLRDGRWVRAERLRPGESLMPLYRDFEPRVRLRPDRPGYTPEHDVIAEALHGPLAGRHVHHADRRRANLAPENVQALSGSEHAEAHHREFADAAALLDERWLCPSCEELYTPTRYNQRRCDACQVLRGYQKQLVGKRAWCEQCATEYEVRSPNHRYCTARCRTLSRQDRRRQGEFAGEGARGRAPATWNHKVLAVQALPERRDVWDIEVEKTHTFVVRGVVVHNCVRANEKRFGPVRAKLVCATLKDVIRHGTGWRKGGGHAHASDDPFPVHLLDDEVLSAIDELADGQIELALAAAEGVAKAAA